ncbi:hypothetical protein M0804_004469 [Polistes exclamans]|nr:hypothetical protein M0804_004469 [Polistes exclamans]
MVGVVGGDGGGGGSGELGGLGRGQGGNGDGWMVTFGGNVFRTDVDECAEMTSQDTSLKAGRMAGSREMGLPVLYLYATPRVRGRGDN